MKTIPWPAAWRAAVLACACAPAAAQPVRVGAPWARATAPLQDSAAAYMTLTSAQGDRLTGVASPDAAQAMLHRATHGGMAGMAGMADMDAVVLPPGRPVALAPRGMHVMLTGLKHPLAAGGTVVLDLIFDHAGRVRALVPVLPIGSAGPGTPP
jgi:copper(I)-binding protein